MSSTTSPPDKCCHYCHKVCQPQRCSRCKKVYYCSKSCQKSDWKLSHRRVCSSSSSSSSSSLLLNGDSSTSTLCKENTTTITDEETHVQRAAEELSHLLGDLSLDQMVEQFHRASDEIRRLQEEEEEGGKERMKEHVGRYDLETEKQTRGKNIDSKSDSTRVESIGYSRFELCDENQREPLVESSCRTTRNPEGEQVTRYDTVPVKIDPVSVQEEQDPFMGQGPSSSNMLEDLYNNYKLETWECIVEKLTYISTLIVTLVPSHLGENCNNDTRDKIHDLPLQHLKIEMYPGTQPDEQGSPSNSHSSFKKHTRIILQNTANRTILQHLNLPFHIISTQEEVQSSLSFEGNVLSMRLMYHDPHQSYLDNIAFESTLTALSPVEALNHLQCRSCHQIVVKRPSPQEKNKEENNKEEEEEEEEEGKGPIQSVFPLPVGYWDEITDYLTCFEGQPSIDFSSSSNNMVRKGVALEDDSLLVLNSNDLEHVCILAVEGYGEAMTPTTETISSATAATTTANTVVAATTANTTALPLQPSRQNATLQQGGNHDWHDVVGGVTLTCGQCCSILGYASFPDADDSSSCRLYKHRLEAINTWRHRSRTSTSSSLSNDQQQHPMMVEDCFQYNNIASFLGKELIRYAESKAIFTFLVFDQDGNGHNGDHDDDDAMSQCLFIRVLSWNTMVARKRNQKGHDHVYFRRCVKVIYQQERDVSKYINEADNVEKKVSRFMGDECCPPSFVVPFATSTSPTTTTDNNNSSNQMPSTRSVNLYLDSQERNELHDCLQDASNFFPDSVSRATVMLKLGVQEENSDTSSSSKSTSRAKLSFLSL